MGRHGLDLVGVLGPTAHGGRAGRVEAKVVEDLTRHRRLSDEGDEAQPSSALGAGEHIDVGAQAGPGRPLGPFAPAHPSGLELAPDRSDETVFSFD